MDTKDNQMGTTTREGKFFPEINADILSYRADRAADLVDDLLGALADDGCDAPPWRKRIRPDVQQAITEARRIRNALTVSYLTGEEAFREGTDGVCLLGEDLDEALMHGHLDRDSAAQRAAVACAAVCGDPLDDHPVEDFVVLHEWVVFEDCSGDDYSDWSWWCHRTREGQQHAVPVTRVQIA